MNSHNKKPSVLERALALLFPTRCICCGCYISSEEFICLGCLDELEDCKSSRSKAVSYYGKSFIIHSAFSYKSAAGASIKLLKFAYNPENAKPMGDILAGKARRLKTKDYDVVTAVPMMSNKKLSRGYNQSELIAKQMAKQLGIKFDAGCIKKMRETKEQHTLSGLERKTNIRGAFAASEQVKGKHIIIVDDVATTGSTICECAETVLRAGARKVTLMTFAATKYSN